MTQENKELLLKDICARLPYGAWVNYGGYEDCDYKLTLMTLQDFPAEDLKPYLRPMSGMTEDESAELSNIIGEWFDKELFYLIEEPFLEYALSKINYSINPLLFDWLNKKMFDYRGLIPMGLALEAKEGMYNN